MGNASLEHRRFLEEGDGGEGSAGYRVAADPALFARIGGQATVDVVVDALYDRFEGDATLRPLFGRDLAGERANQKRFFAEWLGGPARYHETAHAGLAHRHENLGLTRELAGRWLGHFRRALAAGVADAGDRERIAARARSLALALAAADGDNEAGTSCGREHPAGPAAALARRGDVPGLRAWLRAHPAALRPASKAAWLLHEAVVGNRLEAVELLVDAGVDVDKPFYLPIREVGVAFERVLFATPLCAARHKRRRAIEELLAGRGAREDVFTAAFLGDSPGLESAPPDLAQALDPATDIVEITPLHHAIAGGHLAAAAVLLGRTQEPVRAPARALRGAAATESAEMVSLLLERGAGAGAAEVGPGRWVLHPAIAPLLASAGASAASPPGRWVGVSCTGNQGRKDDPDYVRALLAHGARTTDLYLGATALHHAARAGFARTIELLLAHGADRRAVDDAGRTPLDWVERAAKTVARSPIRRLLAS